MEEWTNRALEFAPRLAAGVLMFLAFVLAATVAQKIIGSAGRKADAGKQDVLNLIGQTAKVGLLVFGIVTALGTMGINVSALVAGLGLTGFALGFAFRDSLSNLLAGVLILFNNPVTQWKRFLQGLLAFYTVVWIWLAVAPLDRKDWLLENLLVFASCISVSAC